MLARNTFNTVYRFASINGRPFTTNTQSTLKNPDIIKRKLIINPFRVVPQSEYALRERFEKFMNLRDPGLNVFIPFIDNVVFIPKSEIVYAVTHQEAITKDNASVSADGVFYFKVKDPQKAVYNISNLTDALVNLVVTNLRSVMGSMPLDDLLSGRKHINEELEKVIKPAAMEWGIEVTRVEIKEIKPEPKLVHAMDQQMIAEREKRAKTLSAEGTKAAAILEAEGKKQSMILDAEAKYEVAKLEARARLALAQAEGESLKVIGLATKHDPANYMIARENVKALQQLAVSANKTYVLPNSSSFFASLAAAAEMLIGAQDKNSKQIEPENKPSLK